MRLQERIRKAASHKGNLVSVLALGTVWGEGAKSASYLQNAFKCLVKAFFFCHSAKTPGIQGEISTCFQAHKTPDHRRRNLFIDYSARPWVSRKSEKNLSIARCQSASFARNQVQPVEMSLEAQPFPHLGSEIPAPLAHPAGGNHQVRLGFFEPGEDYAWIV